jgi:hypothetical protein
MDINQTQLLVEQFKHFNIEVHGTYDEPHCLKQKI